MRHVLFLPEAAEEVFEAGAFYDSRAGGLGAAFILALEQALRAILSNPHAGTVIHRATRRRLLDRFPYAVVYVIESDHIIVVAVMHLHRRPDYWAGRL